MARATRGWIDLLRPQLVVGPPPQSGADDGEIMLAEGERLMVVRRERLKGVGDAR